MEALLEEAPVEVEEALGSLLLFIYEVVISSGNQNKQYLNINIVDDINYLKIKKDN